MREQTTIRLPVELKKKIQRQADGNKRFKYITLRIPLELHQELEAMSNQTGMTVTSLLISAIWQNVLRPKCLLP